MSAGVGVNWSWVEQECSRWPLWEFKQDNFAEFMTDLRAVHRVAPERTFAEFMAKKAIRDVLNCWDNNTRTPEVMRYHLALLATLADTVMRGGRACSWPMVDALQEGADL